MENIPEIAQGLIPGEVPTENHIGTYQAQFENIRNLVRAELESAGADYTMSVQKLVRTCINANMEITALAERHCRNVLERFKACRAKLVNHTNRNALFNIDGKNLLVEFDLAHSEHSIMTARQMEPAVFDGQYSVTAQLLLLKQIQFLLQEPIDDVNIVIPFRRSMDAVASARKALNDNRELLETTIASRAYTAFDFDIGMSLYTLNFSEDMTMLFWDRYTISNVTMKSYYVEQYCIIEHTITGEVEPERFIALHKPSKNSLAQFLASRLCCLTSMVRPVPNTDVKEFTPLPVVKITDDESEEDELFTDEDLIDMGMTDEQIAEYHRIHNIDENGHIIESSAEENVE